MFKLYVALSKKEEKYYRLAYITSDDLEVTLCFDKEPILVIYDITPSALNKLDVGVYDINLNKIEKGD